MTDNKKLITIIKRIVWDYNIDPNELYEVIIGKREYAGHFDKKKIFIRMLERLWWYDLLEILGYDFIKENLNEDIIKRIRFPDLREKYEHVRKILHGEPLSFSGWDPEYRDKVKHTLLSNRWYSNK